MTKLVGRDPLIPTPGAPPSENFPALPPSEISQFFPNLPEHLLLELIPDWQHGICWILLLSLQIWDGTEETAPLWLSAPLLPTVSQHGRRGQSVSLVYFRCAKRDLDCIGALHGRQKFDPHLHLSIPPLSECAVLLLWSYPSSFPVATPVSYWISFALAPHPVSAAPAPAFRAF